MKEHHLFPWWAGYLLISPLRKLTIAPRELLDGSIRPGGVFVFAEPHVVPPREFAEELALIRAGGLTVENQMKRGRAAIAIARKAR